jgi:hypothetical protein
VIGAKDTRSDYAQPLRPLAVISVEEIIADFQAKGQISSERAEWLCGIYRYELAQHGNEATARRALLDQLTRTPELRQQAVVGARAIVLDTVLKKSSKRPLPTTMRILQAVIGVVLGAALATGVAFVLIYGLLLVIKMIFGTMPSHFRAPIKGLVAVALAPIAGAVLGGMYGWSFDARVAKVTVGLFLNSSPAIDRAWIAWGVVWTGVVLFTFAVFDPFDRSRFRYWYDDDWLKLGAIWIVPIIGGWAVAKLVSWVAAGRR